jgi:hypothetical protein
MSPGQVAMGLGQVGQTGVPIDCLCAVAADPETEGFHRARLSGSGGHGRPGPARTRRGQDEDIALQESKVQFPAQFNPAVLWKVFQAFESKLGKAALSVDELKKLADGQELAMVSREFRHDERIWRGCMTAGAYHRDDGQEDSDRKVTFTLPIHRRVRVLNPRRRPHHRAAQNCNMVPAQPKRREAF